MRVRVYQILLFVLGMAVLSSCSATKRSGSKNQRAETAIQADKRVEKEIESHLHGDVKILIEEAFEWIGTPYGYGKETKGVAADCSGFVMVVFDTAIGCKLPRISYKQAEFCRKIGERDVKPGDLVFFATGKDPKQISHVGIMVDKTQFLHASSSKGVCLSNLESGYYKTHFIMYGRTPCFE